MMKQIDPFIVEQFAAQLEAATDSNVDRALSARMCCNGQDCGCYGATVGEYLAYLLREACGLHRPFVPAPPPTNLEASRA